MTTVQKKWDGIYQSAERAPKVTEILEHNHYLLPSEGVALDLACGLGGNALLMAEKGLTVHAWDISSVAIARLTELAQQRQLPITAEVRDVVANPPEANSVDVLVVGLFLSRELCPLLSAAIKPGGLLLYQTYCAEKVSDEGPNNPDYLLEDNELLRLFPDMKLRIYREESVLGQHDTGMRNQAWIMLEKPSS